MKRIQKLEKGVGMIQKIILSSAACMLIMAMSGCQPEAPSKNDVDSVAVKPASLPGSAAGQSGQLSGDPVRDLAQLTRSDLASPSPLKEQFLEKYFGGDVKTEQLEGCGDTPSFSEDSFDEVCSWPENEAANHDGMPTFFVGMNTVGTSPNIWSAVVIGDNYGTQPLTGIWECSSPKIDNMRVSVHICTLKSMSTDKSGAIDMWVNFFKSAS